MNGFDSTYLEFIPSPVSAEEWEARRCEYDQIWDEVIHPTGSSTNQHVDGLKLEAERCFCAGAYVACIVLSAALVEIQLASYGAWKNLKGIGILDWLGVTEEWVKLKYERNRLIHGAGQKEDERLSVEDYRNRRLRLKHRARWAIKLSLKVILNNPLDGTRPYS